MGLSAAVCVGIGVVLGLLGGQRLAHRAGFLLVGLVLGWRWPRCSVDQADPHVPVDGAAMNMLDGLSDLEGTALAKVLRRTIVSSLIVGGGAIVVALFALGALGRARDRHRARPWPS